MNTIVEKRKCPICKKAYEIEGHLVLGGMFFQIDKDPCFIYPYCSKECLEEAKLRGLWK